MNRIFHFIDFESSNDLYSFDVRIESDPYWIVKQKDVHVNEGETVDFICNVESKPSPNIIQWFINGVSLQDPSVLTKSSSTGPEKLHSDQECH